MDRMIVMGVSGCGKSAIGSAFANAIGATFIDGDDLHPAENVAKMASGLPLTDVDRAGWLACVAETLRVNEEAVVIACSALKRKYRDAIRSGAKADVMFLHLVGARDVIATRMLARNDHFMPPTLLNSQFAALEPPGPDETSVEVNIDQAPAAIVAELVVKVRGEQK